MSFNRLEADDFVVSADSISATLFSGGEPTLTTFFTSSTQEAGSSGNYYLNVYQTASTLDTAAVQFALVYGNSDGSGSLVYNLAVDGKSPTSTIYGQYQNLVLGDENTDFIFGNITSSESFAIPIERARYKEKLFLQSTALSINFGFNSSIDSLISSTSLNQISSDVNKFKVLPSSQSTSTMY